MSELPKTKCRWPKCDCEIFGEAPCPMADEPVSRKAGAALEQLHPWGYRSEDNEP